MVYMAWRIAENERRIRDLTAELTNRLMVQDRSLKTMKDDIKHLKKMDSMVMEHLIKMGCEIKN